jgi:hypothetical protein
MRGPRRREEAVGQGSHDHGVVANTILRVIVLGAAADEDRVPAACALPGTRSSVLINPLEFPIPKGKK